MSKSVGFLTFSRQEIPRRPSPERIQDWNEVDATPDPHFLKTQANRCMDCGVPFCQSETGCPVDNDIPDWNMLVTQGRWKEAAKKLLATNNFPEFTGRLCPAPCESACVLGINAEAVNIRSLEWGIIERAFSEGWIQPQIAKYKTGKKVAIIGSGPAGLAAAQQLARQGHQVTVFEREASVGGLLRYGIPDFKMQKSIIDRRVQQMQMEGIEFKTSTEFGKNISYDDIKSNFDALAITMGAERPRDLFVPGRTLNGVHFAMDFLREQNKMVSGESDVQTISAKGKRVIIIGGGDTGSDCLGTALRQQAASVLQFEIQSKPPDNRSSATPWPEWPMKLKNSHAHEEGGIRHWRLATQEFLGNESGHVTGLRAENLNDGSTVVFEADLVILALGFAGLNKEALMSIPDLHVSEKGSLQSHDFATSAPGVFTAGDAKRGASLIVWAIAEGRQMATAINKYITGAP